MESPVSQARTSDPRLLSGKRRNPAAKQPRDHRNLRLFVTRPPGRESGLTNVVRIGRFILRGGGPLYELPLIDVTLKRTCLTFPGGTHLGVGELFEIVRPMIVPWGRGARRLSPRRVVALVKIVRVEEGSRAIVRVLGGSVIRGYWAERVEEERISALLHRSLKMPHFFSILHLKPRSGR